MTQMKNAAHFTSVKIAVKPIVKAFLENNFGSPVSIPEQHFLRSLACSQLTKINTRPDLNGFKDYPHQIELSICERNFVFDGHSINEMNTRIFNTAVEKYIKDLMHHTLDALLIAQEKQMNWKQKYLDLLINIGASTLMQNKSVQEMRKELKEHEMNIKNSIEIVIREFLKLDPDDLNYEAVKKDYYRYRMKKFNTHLSREVN